jgi:peptidoglycan/LPS O-acetylase OafA/YrhL
LSLLLLQLFPVTAAGEEAVFVPHLPYIDSAVGAFTASFLCWIIRSARELGGTNVAVALLSWRPLVFVGSFAYSLYLVHYPLVGYSSVFMGRVAGITESSYRAIVLVCIVFPLVMFSAYLFFLAFERPFLSSTWSTKGAPCKALAL